MRLSRIEETARSKEDLRLKMKEAAESYSKKLKEYEEQYQHQSKITLEKYKQQIEKIESELEAQQKDVKELQQINNTLENELAAREKEVSEREKKIRDLLEERDVIEMESNITIQVLLKEIEILKKDYESVICNLTEKQISTLQRILCEVENDVTVETLNTDEKTHKEDDTEVRQKAELLDKLLEAARVAYERGDQRSIHLQVLRSFLSSLPHNLVYQKVGISTKTLARWKKSLEENGNVPGTIPGSGAPPQPTKERCVVQLVFEEIQITSKEETSKCD